MYVAQAIWIHTFFRSAHMSQQHIPHSPSKCLMMELKLTIIWDRLIQAGKQAEPALISLISQHNAIYKPPKVTNGAWWRIFQHFLTCPPTVSQPLPLLGMIDSVHPAARWQIVDHTKQAQIVASTNPITGSEDSSRVGEASSGYYLHLRGYTRYESAHYGLIFLGYICFILR